MPKNPAKIETSDNKDLNNFLSLNCFKVLKEKKIDEKEKQHDEQENLISLI